MSYKISRYTILHNNGVICLNRYNYAENYYESAFSFCRDLYLIYNYDNKAPGVYLVLWIHDARYTWFDLTDLPFCIWFHECTRRNHLPCIKN